MRILGSTDLAGLARFRALTSAIGLVLSSSLLLRDTLRLQHSQLLFVFSIERIHGQVKIRDTNRALLEQLRQRSRGGHSGREWCSLWLETLAHVFDRAGNRSIH